MMHNSRNKLFATITLVVIMLFSFASAFAIPVTINSSTYTIYSPKYLLVNQTLQSSYDANIGGALNAKQICINGVCQSSWISSTVGVGNISGAMSAGYVPSAFNSSHYVNSPIYNNAGSVGIGITTTASAPLHVYSSSLADVMTVESGQANSFINMKVSGGGVASIAGSTGGVLYLGGAAAQPVYIRNGGTVKMTVDAAGKVGIGVAPTTSLLALGNIAAGHNLEFSSGALLYDIAATSGSGLTIFNTQNNWIQFGTNNIARMTVASSGNVGIGTTAPADQLHIADATAVVSTTQLTLEGRYAGYGAGINFTSRTSNGGTLVSMAKISADGEAPWDTTAANQDSGLRFFTTLDGAQAERVRINAAGNVGIGLSPSYKLDVAGTLYASTYVLSPSFQYSSDARLKENVQQLDDSVMLNKVLSLKPVTFEWINKTTDDRTHYGFIAQDVEAILPEAVNTNVEGYKSVEYGNLVAPLVAAVQQQQKQLDVQAKEIASLRADLEALKAGRK